MTVDVEKLRAVYNEAADRRHRELLRAEVERRTAEDPNFDPLCRSHREFWHTSLAEACDAGLMAVAEAALEGFVVDEVAAYRLEKHRDQMVAERDAAKAEVERLTKAIGTAAEHGRKAGGA